MLTEINDNNKNNYENFIHAHEKNMIETEYYPKNIFQNN